MIARRICWVTLLGLGALALGAAWVGRGTLGASGAAAVTPPAVETLTSARVVLRFTHEAASGRLATRAEADTALRSVSRRLGTTISYGRPTSNLAHLVHVRLPSVVVLDDVLRRLRADPAVALVEVDAVVRPALIPDDELFNDTREIQWNLKAPGGTRNGGANLTTAWDRTRGAGVTVAVLDTGIVTHADLAPNVLLNPDLTIAGYDFVGSDVRNPDSGFLVANDGGGRDADPTDPGDWISAGDLASPTFTGCTVAPSSWHGTAMAGVIAAVGNNTIGMAGVAYESKVLPVRVLGKCKGYMSDIADAIRWASGAQPDGGVTWASLGIPTNTTPARVINLSLSGIGTCPTDSTVQGAIDAARGAGAVVVVATGNDGLSTIGSPSSCSGVIAVTSHTVEGDKMSTANWGAGTDLSAPGGGNCAQFTFPSASCPAHGETGAANTIWRELWSADNTGTTTAATDAALVFDDAGTSVAAAHVSGAAALLIAAMPSLTPDGVESILKASARVFPTGTYCWTNEVGTLRCGTGLLDASAAMARLTALTPTVSAQTSAAIAVAGSTVTLTGAATPGSAGSTAALTYRWQQMSGPVVTLSSTTSTSTTFTAPTPGGALSFRFTATDATGASASTTVNMRANTAPTVDALTNQSVRAGQAVTFTATGSDVDGDALTFAATNLPTGATFSSAGVFNWSSATAGTFTVSVTASDGNLTSAARTVTIVVAPNTAPTVNAITNPSVRTGEAVNFTATATDAENDPLTFAATGVPTGATFSAAGVFSWPSATPAGTYTLSITASDGAFTSAVRAVTITVRANTAPTVNTIADRSVRAGQSVTFTATGTDAESDALTFAATGLPSGATFSAAGVFSWSSAVAGTYTVSITASDGQLTSAVRTVTITVTANTAPTVNAIANPSARTGQTVTFTATGTDAEGDPLTFAATGVPSGATFSAAGVFSWPSAVAGTYTLSITASDGVFTSAVRTVTITVAPNTAPSVNAIAERTVRLGQGVAFTATGTDAEGDPLTFAATGVPTGATFSSAGVFNWQSATPAGTYTVSITASDGLLTSAARTVTITVRANTAPTLAAVANQTTRAGQALTFSVPAADAEGDPLVVAMAGLPTGATYTVVDNAAVLSWPSPVAGSYTVTVSASDGLLTTTRQIGITVTPNSAPTVTAVPAQSVRAGASLALTVTGTDPENDALTFAATGIPAGATFSAAGVFNWPTAVVGTYTLSVTASDGVLTSAVRPVSITVRANTAPTVNTVRNFSARLQEAVSVTVTGTDPEGDALTFAATGLPTGASFSTAGVLSWPSASPGGDYSISVTASDGLLTSAPMTFTVTVTNRTTDPGGGGGSMDLLGLALLGLWGVVRVRRRR